MKKKLDKLTAYQNEYESCVRVKELEKLKKKLIKDGLLKNSNQSKIEDKKYIEFEIDGHIVLVGKDAKSNDFLSLKYSKANDFLVSCTR